MPWITSPIHEFGGSVPLIESRNIKEFHKKKSDYPGEEIIQSCCPWTQRDERKAEANKALHGDPLVSPCASPYWLKI